MMAVCLPALAKPKKKLYDNSSTSLFNAALRTARERHVVTYVNEKMLMFTFETGQSFLSKGFVANASVEPASDARSTLIINVQNKQGVSYGAGDRMADKFFDQVKEELAGEVTQKSAVKAEEAPISEPPPKAVPENADVTVDNNFVGNAPVNLKLAPGKHTVNVTAGGYQGLTRELTVMAGSEVHLTANLEKK
jgi:hypothetical protein